MNTGGSDGAAFARRAWQALEPVHAVTYFAPECLAAHREVGLRGFWMGYFGARAAPLGPVPAAVVEAAFYNFHPAMVRRAVPDAWGFAAPEAVLRARAAGAAAALRRTAPSAAGAAAELLPLLARVVAAADGAGRPLFAANRDVPAPEDPVAALWQAATALREHRGDGHVAVLAAEGLDGCEAHVLFAAAEGVPPETLRDNRGWSEDDWRSAITRLTARGLLTPDARPTPAARTLRTHVESRTDTLAARPYTTALTPTESTRMLTLLTPVTAEILASGTLPFPNPMGLPARGQAVSS
ncbi:hypothetical protein AB0A60_00440 [Streptomyces sp. NPDC046275]|uniref:SCO6745 family protein n=1 Tax=Streptomyces sp. NPDC046275 TaxID=3157201 RepID=UPI0033F6A738